MNIVLDMDQTLIDGRLNKSVTPRPYLKVFLNWCFDNFQHVSIWTAASRGWYDYVYQRVFQDMLISMNREFHFVFTGEMCNCVWRFSEWHGQSVRMVEKRIRKLHRYKSEKFIGYCMDNTIAVDDTKTTFQSNYGNGIHVLPFEADDVYNPDWSRDKELLRLLIYLRNVVIPHYKNNGTVLNLEKRYWRNYVIEVENTKIKYLRQGEPDKISEFPDQQSSISEP